MLETSWIEEISEKLLTEKVMLHRSELSALIELLELWRNSSEMFDSRFGDFGTTADVCPELVQADKNYKKLSAILSMFCCDKSIRFGKICVLDTNALMHMPELFKMLESKDTMVIVPQIVLTELDGLKNDEDEVTAYQARNAIRQIDNYSTYDWVNLTEQSDIELLSDDLDSRSPDCRIISIALKYIIHKPVLITDDGNMRNIAKSHRITTMTTEDFVANIHQAELEKKHNTNTSKKKKQKGKKH